MPFHTSVASIHETNCSIPGPKAAVAAVATVFYYLKPWVNTLGANVTQPLLWLPWLDITRNDIIVEETDSVPFTWQ